MDRTIKFRVWEISEYGNEMRYVDLYWFEESMIREWPADNDSAWVGKYELMQFTGLTDRSGKEIYEGDIVQIENYYGEVVWDTINDGWRIRIGNIYNLRNNEMVVVGNVYEHPELLH